ncbi:MAG: hypothetical protein FWE65_04115, partial [Eggerthellaceae bacterium]|nr:hypothetical protein [Eggerthellaceae bacterium]
GPKTEGAEENCGYYGQKLVLLAQKLGLNSCWVGASYRKGKSAALVGEDEKLYLVVSLGYGQDQGKARKSKPLDELGKAEGEGPSPAWFVSALEAAMLAPTAMNQQKFFFTLKDNAVKAERLSGFFSKTDLGIVKCNFEVGAEAAGAKLGQDWNWADPE